MGAVREHLHYSPEVFDALPWWQRHAYLEYLAGRHKLPLFDTDGEGPASGGLPTEASPAAPSWVDEEPAPAPRGGPAPASSSTPPTEDDDGAGWPVLPITRVAGFGPNAA